MAGPLEDPTGLLALAQITRLMDLMRARGVVAFRVRSGEQELEVRWPEQDVAAPTRTEVSEPAVAETTQAYTLHAITSPTVGTYFASSEPGRSPFVSLGQRIEVGDVVCVVESMKLMNEIVADVAGVVVDLPIQNGGSIKAGEVVCLLRLDDER